MHAALKLINHRFQQPDPGATGTPGVAAPPVSMVSQQPGTTPLVLDSPHSGTFYPHDFGAVCDLPTLRRAEDTHVEKIYAFAPALGVAWVEAHFPRIYFFNDTATTEIYTRETIQARLGMRNFMEELRSAGVQTGGPAPFNAADKQRFANALDKWLLKGKLS